jgi:cytochrome c oxidase cbb3-type subunit I/II
VTAETASNESEQAPPAADGSGVARTHLMVAAAFLVMGALVASLAAFQLVIPDLLSGISATTFGRIAPASRLLLNGGWVTLGLLGASYYALSRVTGSPIARAPLATASLALISIGTVAGTVGILLGYQTGLTGQEAPWWARAITAVGALLAAASITSTARTSGDRLGAAGWYLTAAPLWLAVSALVGLVPTLDGVRGPIQTAFVTAGFNGLFAITASVGLLYFVFSTISNSDPTEPRPLAALGFWSLTLVWANMAAVGLMYSPTPDWYETLAVAFAIASLIPLLTIAADLGLMLRGQVGVVADRVSLRYAVVGSLALAAVTVVNLLLAWRATSAVAQFSPLVDAFHLTLVLGGVSFAVFAAHSVMTGGGTGAPSAHAWISTLGGLVAVAGLLVGGVVIGFTWSAGPASQSYVNAGVGWELTAEASSPFLWTAAIGLALFALGQLLWLPAVARKASDELTAPARSGEYHLEFEGEPRYATWGRLILGVVVVWAFAALMTAILPILDGADRTSTLLADEQRTYEKGTAAFAGRDLYISEGCAECHTQQVRPVGTDVGLGPVSLAGDYANENPALLGARRYGPDLMHVASRGEFFDKVLVAAHLEDPRSLVPWSTMPSYSYLSTDDIDALVSYIETLR